LGGGGAVSSGWDRASKGESIHRVDHEKVEDHSPEKTRQREKPRKEGKKTMQSK